MNGQRYNSMVTLLLSAVLSIVLGNVQGVVQHPYEKTLTTINWTSCDEFLNKAVFNTAAVRNIPWTIFYFWSWRHEDSYTITFRVPGREIINRFQSLLTGKLKYPANWAAAEFYIESFNEAGGLLLALNKTGLFRVVPPMFREDVFDRVMTLAIKQVGKYIAMMSCETRFAYALAPHDDMPTKEQADKAASLVGFKGEFGRSYLMFSAYNSSPPPKEVQHEEDNKPYESFERDHDE